MRKLPIIIIFCFFLLECKKNSLPQKKIDSSVQNTFVKIKDQNQIIFIQPTLKYLDSLKSTYKNEDDFYTIADDANYYTAEAGSLLVGKGVDTINISNNKIIQIGEKKITLSKYKPWTLLLYREGGRLTNIYPVDLLSPNDKVQMLLTDFFNTNVLQKNNDNHKNIVTNKNDIIDSLKSNYQLIQKKQCDLNNDGFKDIILVFQPLKAFTQKDKITLDSPVYVLINNGKNEFHVDKNKNIIYTFMPNTPAEGFRDVVIKDNFFTIEQQEGGGKYFIDSYTTFKYDKPSKSIILSKYSKSYTDRNDPDKLVPDDIYTSKNFKTITFEEYNAQNIDEKFFK